MYGNELSKKDDYTFDFYNSLRPIYHQKLILDVTENPQPKFNSISYNSRLEYELDYSEDNTTNLEFYTYSPLNISSEFPHGYSLSMGRQELYYSEYISNQLLDILLTDKLTFKYSSVKVDEDNQIDINANTKVSDLGGLQVKKYISDGGSPRERIREKQELNAKLAQQDVLRDSDEWVLEQGDETGEKAHALFDNLVNVGEIEPLSDEDKEKLTILRRKLQDLEQEYEGLDDNDDRVYEIQESIDETQSEIEELEENDVDVYMMYPNQRYSHYGLQQFEVLIPGFKDREYTVGTEEEMDAAALQYAVSYIDDVGADGFSESFIEDYLDVDAIVNAPFSWEKVT